MMHPPREPFSSSLASSNAPNGSEPTDDDDPEAKAPRSNTKPADAEDVKDVHAWEDVVRLPADWEPDMDDIDDFSRRATQAGQYCREPVPRPAKPFQKWMKTLHKRVLRQQEMLGYDGSLPLWLHETAGAEMQDQRSARHRLSSSDSSFGFVTAVKSASMSIAGVSSLNRSRKTTIRSSRGPRTDRSSRASVAGPRVSEDSVFSERQAPFDSAVVERALRRQCILEELISTEEGYIGDVRFLMNVYVTILASLPTSPTGLRSSVNRNLNDIVELHEEILGELRQAVSGSEYIQPDISVQPTHSNSAIRGHRRWRSLDVVSEGRDRVSCSQNAPGMVAEPETAAEVAKIFQKRMSRFFIYEEYCAVHELMTKDVAAARRMMPGWPSYQKGLEVLASSLGSADNRDKQSKKAGTIRDLLIKPIQRLCKYHLLLSDLLKSTPVIDCPHSHMDIENTLIKLREAAIEIDRAADDPRSKSVLEKTWTLQDRLAFPDQLAADSKNRIRSFGHLRLCGALHVCWQTKDGVVGRYMVALLYRDWFCLATAGGVDQVYTIQACIALGNIKVEEVDNGRGLQCHTAQHSWKIVFLSDNQLYELIMTACSPKEELEWRARLRGSQDQMQSDMCGSLALNIKSLGTVFRKSGTMTRKISVHRATTIGPKGPLCQVILKNTSIAKEVPSPSHLPINRSQSLLTTNGRIPVLAPARAERARLEALLSDVWTRDVLPFPGLISRSKSEHLVRSSASSMMRKLSAVTIPGSFRRTSSQASLPPMETGPTAAAVAGEVKRRASEGNSLKKSMTDHARHTDRACTPPMLSAIADQSEPSQPLPSPDLGDEEVNDESGSARPPSRRASAPDELQRVIDEAHSCASSSGSVVRKSDGGFSRPSLQHSGLSEISVSGREAEARLEQRRSLSLAQGQEQTQGKEKDQDRGKPSSRSRSLRLPGQRKPAKAGTRRREVVVEEIRSWFR